MRMIEIDFEAQPPIDGYSPEGFRVGGAWHPGGLMLWPGGQARLSEMTLDGLQDLTESFDNIDILLIGQGADIAPLAPQIRTALEAADVGYEVMSTPSAARTYNVLLTEDRRVAVALLTV